MNEIILFFSSLDFNWSIIETIAVVLSVLYVILATKQNIWCWAAAGISVALYIYICFSAELFPETGLQVFYLIMAFYGYYNWTKKEQDLQITQWSAGKHLTLIITGANDSQASSPLKQTQPSQVASLVFSKLYV